LNEIVRQVKDAGAEKLIGEYIPTAKNEMVKNHYLNLGFKSMENANQYELEVVQYIDKIHFIEKK
jgi:predicted enzyme involved in methoxymalonyl-ACP biosynthesis